MPAEVVAGAVFGLHAQVQSSAGLMWSARSASAAVGEVERLLWTERRLVKAWFMRGTLHVLPVADFRLHGCARGPLNLPPAYFKYFEVTPAEFDQLMEVVPTVLDGEPKSRRQLVAALDGRVAPEVARHILASWGVFLKPLVRRGLLCFGPPRGPETTFVLASEWLGGFPEWAPDDAAAELARRYLRAFGPATRADFTRWAGLETSRGRVAWARLAPELSEVSVGGHRRWVLTADVEALAATEPAGSVRLLGPFDIYLLAHAERSHLGVPPPLRPRVWRTAGWISPVLLVDGAVAGVWSHEVRSGVVTLSVEPFGRVSRAVRAAVGAEAERLGRYLGARPKLVWAA